MLAKRFLISLLILTAPLIGHTRPDDSGTCLFSEQAIVPKLFAARFIPDRMTAGQTIVRLLERFAAPPAALTVVPDVSLLSRERRIIPIDQNEIGLVVDPRDESPLYFDVNHIYLGIRAFLARRLKIEQRHPILESARTHLRMALAHEISHSRYTAMTPVILNYVLSELAKIYTPDQIARMYEIMKEGWPSLNLGTIQIDYFSITKSGDPLYIVGLPDGKSINFAKLILELLGMHSEGSNSTNYLMPKLRKAGLTLEQKTPDDLRKILDIQRLWRIEDKTLDAALASLENEPMSALLFTELRSTPRRLARYYGFRIRQWMAHQGIRFVSRTLFRAA